jgi:hypothetical protein
MRRSAVITLLLVLAWARPATGYVLSEDEIEGSSRELGVVLRAFHFLLTGEILKPPYRMQDGNPTGIGLLDLRLYFIETQPDFKLVLHNQLVLGTSSQGGLGSLSLGRSLAPPQWLPLRFEADDDPTLTLASAVDWLYGSYTRGPLTLTLGRQPISVGRARIWSPMDLVGTFSLTEVDTEYKPGADAARLDWSVDERTDVMLVASVGELEDDHDLDVSLRGSSFIARAKRGWSWGELGAMGGYVRRDGMVGVDAVVDTGSFQVYGEATATLVTGDSLGAPGVDSGDIVPRAVVGATFQPHGSLTVAPEIFYSGFGAWAPRDYLDVAVSERAGIGEQTTLGRLYGAALVSWEMHPLLSANAVALVNLRDPSTLLSLALRHNLAGNVDLLVGGYVPVGRRPETTALSPASEFGLYPYFFFAELKAAI